MTRETKVGLLVGMGVILLIGIIVSDQLSHIQREESADLTNYASDSQRGINAVDNSAATTVTRTPRVHQSEAVVPADATDLPPSPPRPQVREPQAGSDFADLLARRLEQARESIVKSTHEETIMPVTLDRLPPAPTAIRRPATPKPKLHTVVSGDSLYRIAERYLGDGNRWRDIAKANPGKVSDDGQVRTGVTLTIPPEAPEPPEAPPDAQGLQSLSVARTYTVKAGDSLYSIAQKKMGNGNEWKKLYEANRDSLKNPDSLSVGQTLRIPPGSP